MQIRITIDVFSGRRNPVIELRGREAAAVMERLKPERRLERVEGTLPPQPRLGYRGMVIEQIDGSVRGLPKMIRFAHGNVFGRGLSHRAQDEDFEDFVCGSTGPLGRLRPGRDFPGLLKKEIKRAAEARGEERAHPRRPRRRAHSCTCAPLYEPNWWNDDGQRQYNNNCYNYGTNYRSDTYAQPGLAAGAMYTSLDCSSVKPAAIADALIDSPNAQNNCPPEGHLVALVVFPGGDFHWYRKGRDGYWTHKMGGSPATNVDNSGALIVDPRTADRGPYTDFCSFMVVMHGHVKIA
jgi:hypothetical protein